MTTAIVASASISMPALRHALPALFLCLPFAGAAQAAEAAPSMGAADCRVAPLKPLPTRVGVKWSGACKDGHADGPGVLEWFVRDEGKRRLEGTLLRGEVAGEGTLTYRDAKYIGTFRQGMPHGAGYFEYTNGEGRYEGGVADGLHEGAGMHIALDRSTYEGEWKAGKRHGSGKAVFTLGGSYEGQWRDDEFNGQGKIVYGGSGRTWSGEFREGRAAGATRAPPLAGAARPADDTPVALLMRQKQLIGAIPLDTEWGQLTSAQQNMVRAGYPALDDRDEPPYPLKGRKEVHSATTDLYARYNRFEGDVVLYVVVGADGVPKTVNTYTAPHPEFGRFLAMAMMIQRFKPARCAGTPCEMIYPIKFSFSLED